MVPEKVLQILPHSTESLSNGPVKVMQMVPQKVMQILPQSNEGPANTPANTPADSPASSWKLVGCKTHDFLAFKELL